MTPDEATIERMAVAIHIAGGGSTESWAHMGTNLGQERYREEARAAYEAEHFGAPSVVPDATEEARDA